MMRSGTFWILVIVTAVVTFIAAGHIEIAWLICLANVVAITWLTWKDRYGIAERMLARRHRKHVPYNAAAEAMDALDPACRASEFWAVVAYNDVGTESLVTLYYEGVGWKTQIWEHKHHAEEALAKQMEDPLHPYNGGGESLELRQYVWTGEREKIRG